MCRLILLLNCAVLNEANDIKARIHAGLFFVNIFFEAAHL